MIKPRLHGLKFKINELILILKMNKEFGKFVTSDEHVD